MSYYERQIFFCTNRRDGDGRPSCARANSEELADHAKKLTKKLDIAGAGKVRVQKSSCLDRCEEGPIAVVYPDAVWYTFIDKEDVDEIVESHLRDGKIVDRLKI
ncbi:NAD(P)H-dependent oxidoreductase subunit E [soil metagenome]